MGAAWLLLVMLPIGGMGAWCVGADPCLACKDCSKCKYCDPKNPQGGSCGVKRAQTEAERLKAEKKKAGSKG